jgi:hypothetical protein
LESLTEREREWLGRVTDAARNSLAASREVVGMAFLFFGDDDMEAIPIGFKDDTERHSVFGALRETAAERRADAFLLVGEAYRFRDARTAQLVQYEGVPAKDVPSDDVIVVQMEVPGVFLAGHAEIGPDRRTLGDFQMRRIARRDIGRFRIEAVLNENLKES